jgi:2,4-dienoyl-CoA reductase-like NADH-dependent reductase (Old Yellow Enzyme family)
MQAVLSGGKSSLVMVETTYEHYLDDMKQIADVVHENGSLIFVQLNHAGYKTAKSPGYDRLGVSEQEVTEGYIYHEATPDEIKGIAEAFGDSAKRCKEAGCDGVQIHAGHSYLLNTFLSPYYNHRTDSYGGPIENRARILFEVYSAVRNAVGNDYPVSVKIPFSDRVSPSITPEECLYVCKELEKNGIDMIEVTSGLTMDGGESSFTPFAKGDDEGNFLDGAVQITNAVSVPVVSVCGYRTPDFIEQTLNETPITAISLCRPLIREPNLPNRWKTDRTKATCISCNQCYKSSGIIACQVKKSNPKPQVKEGGFTA